MSIYQEEMMRKLPKLRCTGTLDEATKTLSIRQNGVFLCRQLIDGTLFYTMTRLPRRTSVTPSQRSAMKPTVSGGGYSEFFFKRIDKKVIIIEATLYCGFLQRSPR